MKRIPKARLRDILPVVDVPNPALAREADLLAKGIVRWTRNHPPRLVLWDDDRDGYVLVPHGACPYGIVVRESALDTPRKWLRPYQMQAVRALLERDCGQLIAPCGAGKTAIGIGVLQALTEGGMSRMVDQFRALVIVHTVELQRQWVTRLASAGLSAYAVKGSAALDAVMCVAGRGVFVCTAQALSRRLDRLGMMAWDAVIVDECHHTPSSTFTEVLRRIRAECVYGLTATPVRKDGMHVVMEAYLGPVAYEVSRDMLVDTGSTLVPEVRRIDTQAYTMASAYSEMVKDLGTNPQRNDRIVETVREHGAGISWARPQLVLTLRVGHALLLEQLLRAQGIKAACVTGKTPAKQRQAAMAGVLSGDIEALVATQFADEGLDIPQLDAVHLVMPARGDGKGEESGGVIEQRVGRICRPYPGKGTPIVYDYVDDDSLTLSQWRSRQKVYRRLGWHVTYQW